MNRARFLQVAAAAVAAPYVARLERAGDALAAIEPPAPGPLALTVGRVGGRFRVGDILRLTTSGEMITVTAINPPAFERYRPQR